MSLRFIDQTSFAGKRVLARFDLNVPLEREKIADATRIDRALGTIESLIEDGASKIVLMSHLGRPEGKATEALSLRPVASYLADKLNREIVLTQSCYDGGIGPLLELSQFQIILLENLRFHPEEMANDLDFARTLSQYGDFYVNDAFGACHRKHASVYG